MSGIKKYYINNSEAHALLRGAMKKQKTIAAMCNGHAILAEAGILKGRKVASYMATEIIHKHGGEMTYENITIDGNIITATMPGIDSFVTAVVDAVVNLGFKNRTCLSLKCTEE